MPAVCATLETWPAALRICVADVALLPVSACCESIRSLFIESSSGARRLGSPPAAPGLWAIWVSTLNSAKVRGSNCSASCFAAFAELRGSGGKSGGAARHADSISLSALAGAEPAAAVCAPSAGAVGGWAVAPASVDWGSVVAALVRVPLTAGVDTGADGDRVAVAAAVVVGALTAGADTMPLELPTGLTAPPQPTTAAAMATHAAPAAAARWTRFIGSA
jgi:hypothetical protein